MSNYGFWREALNIVLLLIFLLIIYRFCCSRISDSFPNQPRRNNPEMHIVRRGAIVPAGEDEAMNVGTRAEEEEEEEERNAPLAEMEDGEESDEESEGAYKETVVDNSSLFMVTMPLELPMPLSPPPSYSPVAGPVAEGSSSVVLDLPTAEDQAQDKTSSDDQLTCKIDVDPKDPCSATANPENIV